jgi:hypothetical protein
MQSRRRSLLESIINTAIGYTVAVVTQYVTFPWFGIEASHSDHFGIAAIFTVVSIARNYLVRRGFNRWPGTSA